jgi:hypothetical protein
MWISYIKWSGVKRGAGTALGCGHPELRVPLRLGLLDERPPLLRRRVVREHRHPVAVGRGEREGQVNLVI